MKDRKMERMIFTPEICVVFGTDRNQGHNFDDGDDDDGVESIL